MDRFARRDQIYAQFIIAARGGLPWYVPEPSVEAAEH